MAYYSSYSKDYLHGDELVKKIYREIPRHDRHGHTAGRPTQYIVNDGTLVIDDKSLRHNSSVIYNRPGSTMYVQPIPTQPSGGHHHQHRHHQQWTMSGGNGNPNYYATDPYYYGGAHYNNHGRMASLPYYNTGSNLHTCQGCSWRRELTGGYCRECIDLKLVQPRVLEVVRDERRLLGAPERRLLDYR